MEIQLSINNNVAAGIIPIDDRRHQPLGGTIVTVDDRRHQLLNEIILIDYMRAQLQVTLYYNAPFNYGMNSASHLPQEGNFSTNSSSQTPSPLNSVSKPQFIKILASINQNESDPNTKLAINETILALATGDVDNAVIHLNEAQGGLSQQLANLPLRK